MTTHSYRFHGVNLSVSGEEAVLTALRARLGGFPAGEPQDEAGLRFEFHRVPETGRNRVERPAGPGRPVLDTGLSDTVYFDARQQLYLEVPGRGRALCDFNSRRVHVSYPEAEAGDTWLLSHPFFTIPLAELLKRMGLYMVHAAGLSVAGKGLLVAGQSGAGKTTLAIALVRAGFGFLADDTVFLCSGERGLRILAFPDEVDVTPHTLEFFPELQQMSPGPKLNPRLKQAVCVTTIYGVRPCWECVPEVIVFPRRGQPGRSMLSPMPKAEALLELVCNVLRTDARSSQAHLDALAELVRKSRCFRLQTGRDFDRLPELLRSVMDDPALSRVEVQ